MLSDSQRAELDAIERGDVTPYERGVLGALARDADGSDRRRIDALLVRTPRPEPVFTGDAARFDAGVERARSWT